MPETQAAEKPGGRAGGVLAMPSTKLGWWSVWLMVAFAVMFVVNQAVFMNLPESVPWRTSVLPFYGIAMLACGLAAGVTALIAIIRKRERSWLVWLPLLAGLNVVFLLVGEFAFPH
jgi:hypothetical protein